MTTPTFWDNVLEFFYVLIGLQLGYTAYKAFTDQTNQKRIGTGLFWLDLGLLFALGKVLPTVVSGVLVVFLGIVTIINQFEVGKFANFSMDALVANAKRYRNWVFFPVLCLAIVSMLLAKFIPDSSKVAIGFAAVIGTVFAWLIFRGSFKATMAESDRMIQSMGTSGVLPQLLAALGVIFSISGVGTVIADAIGGVVPEGSRFFGVVAYVLGMVLFTAIMGNAFAAFTVITAGIGIPFVIAQGANPAIAGALAMTAGYCGTLLTPMAANFNALPASLMEMKNPYGVIKEQAPMATLMIVVHIVLMYFWAF